MRKEWIDPNEIYVHRELNNRELNTDYIGDLSQSMQDKGFLPEFPIDVFETVNIANVDAEQPFVCACGAHRTLAAVNAKLEQVLVVVHDGREEAFIEMMHLDNFKFDPAINSGIGQPFTQREKRAAVTQLLLLPKFFEQTNTALQEALRIPESSIRRWRKEVVKMLEDDHPILTEIWGVSDGRLKRLRELANSSERVDQEGKTVKVRKPLAEPTDEEKHEFYKQIEEDSWIPGNTHNFDWDHVVEYLQRTHEITGAKWFLYEELTMKQLQDLHKNLLNEEKDFIRGVVKIANTERKVRKERQRLSDATDETFKQFKKIFAPKEDKYSQEFKDMRASFTDLVKKSDPRFAYFQFEYYDYEPEERDNPTFCEVHAGLHEQIADDLYNDAGWLKEFRDKETKRIERKHKRVMKDWEKHREDAIKAINDYPRHVSQDRILSVAAKQLDFGRDRLQNIHEMTTPSPSKFTSTLKEEAALFKKLADAVKTDRQWVRDIPEAKALVDVLTDRVESEKSEGNRNPLESMTLEDIFEHIRTRADGTFAVSDGELFDCKHDIFEILGQASGGIFESQINLLADIGLFLCRTKEVEDSGKK